MAGYYRTQDSQSKLVSFEHGVRQTQTIIMLLIRGINVPEQSVIMASDLASDAKKNCTVVNTRNERKAKF
jgi:hypothetical protein